MTKRRWIIPALLAATVAVVVLLLVVSSGDNGKPKKDKVVTVRVDGPDPGVADDRVLKVPRAAIDRVEKAETGDLSDSDLGQGDKPEQQAGVPLATQEFPGCRTQFVNNQSSRGGVTVRNVVWHYTVSTDRPGWGDNDALTAMSNTPANGVSWNFSIGGHDGNCAYNVPLTQKPWTQGNANPFSEGIEVIRLGNETNYVEGAGKRRLYKVTKEVMRRMNIPIADGLVVNCQPRVFGLVSHSELGLCGGGHHDINPWQVNQYRDEFLAWAKPIPGNIKSLCKKIGAYRRAHKEANKWQRARIKKVKASIYYCSSGKAHRKALS